MIRLGKLTENRYLPPANAARGRAKLSVAKVTLIHSDLDILRQLGAYINELGVILKQIICTTMKTIYFIRPFHFYNYLLILILF